MGSKQHVSECVCKAPTLARRDDKIVTARWYVASAVVVDVNGVRRPVTTDCSVGLRRWHISRWHSVDRQQPGTPVYSLDLLLLDRSSEKVSTQKELRKT